MSLANYPILRTILFSCLAIICILLSSCEDPSSVEKLQPEEQAGHADFFAYASDSVNAMLVAAIDTLRKADRTYPFVSDFIAKRGIPVWSKASGFYREGNPVFKVPVRHAQKRKITGFVTILIEDSQPDYDWTPRGAKADGKIDKGLEVIMWMYEKRVFGKTHTNDGKRIVTKSSSSAPKTGNVLSEMQDDCSKVCLPGDCHNRPWNCDDGGPGGGNDGGDDGGYGPHGGGDGGGGTGDGDNSDDNDDNNDNEDPDCPDSAANIPFPGLMDPDEDDNPYDGPSSPPPCEQEEGDDGNSFMGDIDASDLKNHPKADCVYGKLDATNTFRGVISKFAGRDTDFDLDIKVGKVDGGYGTLDSGSNTNTFVMELDEAGILQRKSIETAATFLHEAIHAEMRRYLYGSTDTSTLTGFPGDFTHDWELYVKEFYGNNVEPAEHEAMAVKYRNIIVGGLKEYDNDKLSLDEYRALAWHGLSNTKYYREVLSDNEKQKIVDDRQNALNKTTGSCN